MNPKKKQFAIVPFELINSDKFNPYQFRVISYCLAKYNIPTWTFSIPIIQKECKLSKMTTNRTVKSLLDMEILKLNTTLNIGKHWCKTYIFDIKALNKYLIETDESHTGTDESHTGTDESHTGTDESHTGTDESHTDTLISKIEKKDLKEDNKKNVQESKNLDFHSVNESKSGLDLMRQMEEEFSLSSVNTSTVLPSVSVNNISRSSGVLSQLSRKSTARDFGIVFNDPVLRAEFKSALDQSALTQEEMKGLTPGAIQLENNKRSEIATTSFKAKYNLI